MPVGTYTRKDGSTWWWARVNHKHQRDYKQGFSSEEEAWEWYWRRKRELMVGDPGGPPAEITFSEMANRFMEFKRPRVRHSTLDDYETQLRLRILPKWGTRKLNSITPLELQAWLDKLATKEASPNLANKARFVMGSIYRLAIRYGLAKMDPTRAVTGFKVERPESRALNMDEIRKILYNLDERWATQIIFTVATGMRIGEVNALTWGDVAPTHVKVDKSFRKKRLEGPKTYKSKRRVTISPAIYELLMRHKRSQGKPPDDALVFPNHEGRHLESWRVREKLNEAADKVGIGHVKVHDLRSTYTTWMVEGERDIKLIQDQLGHADISTTLNIYAHTTEKSRREYREWFDTHIAPNLLRGFGLDEILPEEEKGKIVPLGRKRKK